MKVLVGLLVAVLALQVATAAEAFPTDWKQKKYFYDVDSELRLTTGTPDAEPDCAWKGPRDGVYVTTPNVVLDPPDWPDWNCQTFALWAKTCKGAAQTVVFTKEIPYLPGPALDLDASLVSYGDRPMSMTLEINGSTALSAVKSVHKRDLRGKESLFKIGKNTIEVRARKPNTGAEDCNRNGTEYALYATIRATFANDMVATPPKGSATGGATGIMGVFKPGAVFQGTMTVRNVGPSRASIASVSVGAYTSHLAHADGSNAAIFLSGGNIDIDECFSSYGSFYYEKKRGSYTGYSVTCSLGPLEPGESVTVTITYKYLYPSPGEFYEEWPITWGASADLFDPKRGNNGGVRMQNVCRPAGPNCKPPQQ